MGFAHGYLVSSREVAAMDEDRRRLSALLLTDLVGYTALAPRDEKRALRILSEQAEIVRAEVTRHAGREVKCTEDGFLVGFQSALAALGCALSI